MTKIFFFFILNIITCVLVIVLVVFIAFYMAMDNETDSANQSVSIIYHILSDLVEKSFLP